MVLGVVLVLVLGGCEQLIGADFDEARPSREVESTCESAAPTEAPDISNAGGDVELTLVIHRVDFGDGANKMGVRDPTSKGFDLDSTCTAGDGDPPRCLPPAWTDGNPLDGQRGEDNGVGLLLASQEKLFGLHLISSELLNTRLEQGLDAPIGIMRVRGYSGLADDDQVDVDWYVPLAANPEGMSGFDPLFDGTDEWPVRADRVTGDFSATGEPPDAVLRDTNAYVSKFRLVARFGETPMPLANIYFEVRSFVLAVDLLRDQVTRRWGGSNGTLAAVASADAILGLVPQAAFFSSGVGVCTTDQNYALIKKFVCQVADMRVDSDGPECDGTSLGLSFEAAPVIVGPLLPPSTIAPFCAPGSDPVEDTCSAPPH